MERNFDNTEAIGQILLSKPFSYVLLPLIHYFVCFSHYLCLGV